MRAEPPADYDRLSADFAAALVRLADEAERAAERDAAEGIRRWAIRRDGSKIYVFHPRVVSDLPSTKGDVPRSDDSPPGINGSPPGINDPPPSASGRTALRLAELRRAHAAALLDLARKAAEAGRDAEAHSLVYEALREDPDLAEARRILGYLRVAGDAADGGSGARWLEPWSAAQHRLGRRWHGRFGWIDAGDVAEYERGQRRHAGRWITAEQDARIHQDIQRGWRIETEHYVVTTNHSLEAGVEMADQLERLHCAWRQAFGAYWLAPGEMKRRFAGEPPRDPLRREGAQKHRVTCFGSRDEYVQHLKRIEPRIGISIGYYSDRNRTVYFFAGEGQDPGTLLHEATHQLFAECLAGARLPGRRDNFWIVEAIACYMESLTGGDGYDTLGGPEAGRMLAARERLLDDGFYVPLDELVRFSTESLQRDPRIAPIYSQSAGMAAFLMQYEGGRYREPLVAYLRAVYTGTAQPGTLAELAGTSYAELDRQYREFLKSLEQASGT